MPRLLNWKVFLAVLGCFCVLSFVTFVVQIIVLNKQQNVDSLHEYVWAIEELRVEYYQTLYLFKKVSRGEPTEFPQARLFQDPARGLLHLRMDVLSSRTARLSDDVILRRMAADQEYERVVRRIESDIAAAARLLTVGEQIQTTVMAERLISELSHLETNLNELSINLVQQLNQLDALRLRSLAGSVSVSQFSLFALIAFMAVSLFLAIRLSSRERKRSIELAKTNAVLDAANRSKERFVAQMSHEFRTPLNAIIGFSEIMRNKEGLPNIERYAEYSEDVHQSAVHLLSLVNEILTFSELSANPEPFELMPVELTGLIENSIRLVHGAHDTDRIALAGMEDGRHVQAMGEDHAIRQIVHNLLNNASKYAGSDADIRVALLDSDPDKIGISISDTGPGMDPETLERVLKPFERNTADGKTFEQIEGVGLGLPICCQLADRLNARLLFETAPGEGFTATLWLARVPHETTSRR
ncbi:sensor histidine kinase [Minwuia sp.]|uniref:sensor histidine kinase n=1 Tax=Minwuia sp. TaxID=2493630 RepID=UPI003A92168E